LRAAHSPHSDSNTLAATAMTVRAATSDHPPHPRGRIPVAISIAAPRPARVPARDTPPSVPGGTRRKERREIVRPAVAFPISDDTVSMVLAIRGATHT